jgi:hypothetical protein
MASLSDALLTRIAQLTATPCGTPPAFLDAMRNSFIYASLLAFCACTGGTGDDGGDSTSVTGQGVYRDEGTNHDGTAAEPASPPAQDMNVSIIVDGTGTIPNPDPQCALDPAGAFHAVLSGTATVDDSGAYVASMGSATSAITTPSGCTIPTLTVGAVTDVKVRAELDATTENCQTYCAASARADAEAQCGSTADQAECRATAEGDLEASCQTTCTTERDSIVAEADLGAGAIGSIDEDALRAAALGSLTADLTFDHDE